MSKFQFSKTKGWIERLSSSSPGAESRDCTIKLLITLDRSLFDASSESDRALLKQFEAYVAEVTEKTRQPGDGWKHTDDRRHPMARYTIIDRLGREICFEAKVVGHPRIKCETLLYWEATLKIEGELRKEQVATLYDMSNDAVEVTTSCTQSDIPDTPSGHDRVPDPETADMFMIEHEVTEGHLLEFDSPRQLPPGAGPRALPPGDGPIELGPIESGDVDESGVTDDADDDAATVIDDDDISADREFLDTYESDADELAEDDQDETSGAEVIEL